MEETRSAAVWGKSVTGGSLWWRVPVQQELKVSKLNYVWQEQTVWAGPTRPTITATGGLQSLRRETAKRGNTHIYIHTVSGQMGVHSHTHIHTYTHTYTSGPVWVHSLTQACIHCRDTVASSYQHCCALCTQRGCQRSLTHLYSVMIMQCHAGTDYIKVSEGRSRMEGKSSETGSVMWRVCRPETSSAVIRRRLSLFFFSAHFYCYQ